PGVGYLTGKNRLGEIIREFAVVIGTVHLRGESQLPEVIDATRPLALGFARGKRRQQQRSQNGDDRQYHQDFDQGESPVLATVLDLLRHAVIVSSVFI